MQYIISHNGKYGPTCARSQLVLAGLFWNFCAHQEPNMNQDTQKPARKPDSLFVESVEKAFRVLEAFSGDQIDLGLVEIIARTGLNKSAAQRFTHTLLRLGYLKRDPASRRYALSQKVLISAHNFLSADTLVNRAIPYIIDLRRQLNMRVGMGCLHGQSAMYLIPLQSNKTAFRTAHPGFKVPIFCTSTGRALLAGRPDTEARAMIEQCDRKSYTPYTITDVETLMAEISRTRDQGFCITDQEFVTADINIAAAITDAKGQAIATVTASGPKSVWTRTDLETKVAELVMDTARTVSMHSHHLNN
ncbi:IclR family transcriptional regulator [Profundibacter amoris]|uniref:IclR family transcriptional regulator n=1 Tax=Profundibacter amoris TaxID=2171755 RepID=A0A347UFT6_9RHOB|nr:IclR family transcriptional regulator [Profundibacter amoris]AXX97714.1 IclR family transcriptional regulator [Profundibacter amoris]